MNTLNTAKQIGPMNQEQALNRNIETQTELAIVRE